VGRIGVRFELFEERNDGLEEFDFVEAEVGDEDDGFVADAFDGYAGLSADFLAEGDEDGAVNGGEGVDVVGEFVDFVLRHGAVVVLDFEHESEAVPNEVEVATVRRFCGVPEHASEEGLVQERFELVLRVLALFLRAQRDFLDGGRQFADGGARVHAADFRGLVRLNRTDPHLLMERVDFARHFRHLVA